MSEIVREMTREELVALNNQLRAENNELREKLEEARLAVEHNRHVAEENQLKYELHVKPLKIPADYGADGERR